MRVQSPLTFVVSVQETNNHLLSNITGMNAFEVFLSNSPASPRYLVSEFCMQRIPDLASPMLAISCPKHPLMVKLAMNLELQHVC